MMGSIASSRTAKSMRMRRFSPNARIPTIIPNWPGSAIRSRISGSTGNGVSAGIPSCASRRWPISPTPRLAPDAGNLGLVLNRLRREPAAKERFLDALRNLYDSIDDFDLQIEGGAVQVFIQESGHAVPATRLSDGTLRYLSLLAILCHPDPGPLICIEEPELGMRPDIMVTIAELLVEASENTQLVVTTHSEMLVDALAGRPESIFVAESDSDGTQLERLEADQIKPWLEEYGGSLGKCWMQGHIGGLRW